MDMNDVLLGARSVIHPLLEPFRVRQAEEPVRMLNEAESRRRDH